MMKVHPSVIEEDSSRLRGDKDQALKVANRGKIMEIDTDEQKG